MSELLHHFGIEWRLLAAQSINFFILLFILKKFAYRPLLSILNKRKEDIARGIALTKKAEVELADINILRDKTLEKANLDAMAVVENAEQSGKRKKDEILKEAQKKAEDVLSDAHRIISEDRAKMGESVYQNAEDLVRLGIEKVLGRIPEKARDELLIKDALAELRQYATGEQKSP